MALSQAEKQRRYRERHLGHNGEKQRIQCVVGLRTKLKLKRLAHYYGCSVTTLIENLAADAEEVIVREIASRDIGDYYSAKLQCTSPLRPWRPSLRQILLSLTAPSGRHRQAVILTAWSASGRFVLGNLRDNQGENPPHRGLRSLLSAQAPVTV